MFYSVLTMYAKVLFNHAETDYEIAKGDRVAQLVITKIDTPQVF